MNQTQKGLAPIAVIGLVVLVLAITGGTGYYLFNKNKSLFVNSQNQQLNINYGIVLKQNLSDSIKTDVYLKDPLSGIETFYITLSDIYSNHYHPAEYRNGNLYIISRTGGNFGYETNLNWKDELWKYNSQKQGMKIFSNQGVDFRVSEDEKFIAIVGSGNLTFIGNNGNILKSFNKEQLKVQYEISPIKWSSSYFWMGDAGPVGILQSIKKINAINFQITDFDVSSLFASDSFNSFDLNATAEKIVFDNRPFMFDVDSEKQYEQSGAKVSLTVYDLNTKVKQVIATSITKRFNPKWINNNTIEYDNPNGEGRITKQI